MAFAETAERLMTPACFLRRFFDALFPV